MCVVLFFNFIKKICRKFVVCIIGRKVWWHVNWINLNILVLVRKDVFTWKKGYIELFWYIVLFFFGKFIVCIIKKRLLEVCLEYSSRRVNPPWLASDIKIFLVKQGHLPFFIIFCLRYGRNFSWILQMKQFLKIFLILFHGHNRILYNWLHQVLQDLFYHL